MTTDSERAYLRELRRYVKALRKLLAITGPEHEPPGFADEIAAGDPWTEDEVFTYWDAMTGALSAFPMDHCDPPERSEDVESWVGPAQLWLKNRGRLIASIRILLRVCDQWQLPIKEGGAKGVWEIGTYVFDAPRVRFQGEADWRPIVAPTIGREDHAALTWACNAMERLADDAERDGHEEQPPDGVNHEVVAPRPSFVLDGPGGLPQLDGETLEPLSADQHDTLQALCEAGPRGLNMYDLKNKSGVDYPERILRELRDGRKGRPSRNDHAAWKRIVLMSGKKHGRYRLDIAWPEEFSGGAS